MGKLKFNIYLQSRIFYVEKGIAVNKILILIYFLSLYTSYWINSIVSELELAKPFSSLLLIWAFQRH